MNTTNNQYLYPLTIFDKVVKFKTLADMNQVVYALYHPSAKETINLTNFDEVVGYKYWLLVVFIYILPSLSLIPSSQ